MIFEMIKDTIASVKFDGIYISKEIQGSEQHNPFPNGSLLFDIILIIQLYFMFVGYYHCLAYVAAWILDLYDWMTGKQSFRKGEIS